MKIKEIGTLNLNETIFKLSDRSITAKVNNKTKAVINDIQLVKTLPFNKQVEYNVQFDRRINQYFDALYIGDDKRFYYFIDQKYHELLIKSDFKEELQKLLEKVQKLSSFNVNVLFLNVCLSDK